MAGETILIIDADEAVEQKIMTALEAKGYLVFTAASQVLNAETLEKLGPSLIYIAPVKPGAPGLETCKAVHGSPNSKKVPIVLLGSREGSNDLQNPAEYGIVDFLPLIFSSDELIKKTEKVLGGVSPSHLQKGNGWGVEKSAPAPRPIPRVDPLELDPQVNEWESIDRALSEKHKRTVVSEPWTDVEEDQEGRPKDEPLWLGTDEGVEKKRFAFLRPAIGGASFRVLLRLIKEAAIIVAIVGVGLLVYQQFAPTPKVFPIRPATTPSPAPPKVRDARPEHQLPKEKKAADASDPASQTPASQASASPQPTEAAPSPSKSASPVPAAPVPPAGLPQTPSPPVKPAPHPPSKPFYAVQIGAYKDEANAQELAKKFLDKGYDAFVQAGVTRDETPIYRVLVSKSEDRETAKKLAEEIRSKERIQTTVFSD